jgi:hypothetical protein
LKIRTNIDDNYEIHSTSSKSIEKNRQFNPKESTLNNEANGSGGVVAEEDEAINKFLNTYDKEYTVFFERIDKLRKSTSRERGGGNSNNISSADNKRNN